MIRIGIGLIVTLLLAACGPARSSETQTSPTTLPTRTPVPTFTATPLSAEPMVATGGATPVPAQTSEDAPPDVVTILPATLPPAEAPATEPAITVTTVVAPPSGDPMLTVSQDAINVRAGPGTDYPIVSLVMRAATYPITGRNAAGDWWQVCCIDGQSGWLFGALVTVANADAVAVAAGIPPAPAVAAVAFDPPPTEPPPAEEAPAVMEAGPPQDPGGTAGNFDPNAQYQIVNYRVLGFDDNNGGIFNKGGQQLIFVTVLDQNGAPVDGAVVKDAVGDKLNVVTGSKGPGKAEIKMDWDPYKLYVASDPAGAATSQVSNQMNNPHPHLPDVIGKLGPPDNEYAVCPTPEVNCSPPFFTVHFSYDITFQRVR